MPPSPSAFGEAMQSLSSLLASDSALRQRNLDRMRSLTARLDEISFMPTEEAPPAASRSTPEQTATARDQDDESLRSFLPRRSDPSAGGDYGSAILERVARSYGVHR